MLPISLRRDYFLKSIPAIFAFPIFLTLAIGTYVALTMSSYLSYRAKATSFPLHWRRLFLELTELPAHSQLAVARVEGPSVRGAQPAMQQRRCHTDVDCCPSRVEKLFGDSCGSFCRHSSEIAEQSSTGWKVDGVCAVKWPKFCLEDENCVSGEFCDRQIMGDFRAGICVVDSKCAKEDCSGRGTCRDGHCICHFAFVGSSCERSTDAFAFLIYGESAVNFVQARVLVRSLRTNGAAHDIIAIVPESCTNSTPSTLLAVLQHDGVKIRYTKDIPMPPAMASDPVIRSRWSGVMNKFAVWQLTEYTRVAMVDTDIVVDLQADDAGDIFRECTAPLCAVRDGDPRFMNGGVIVVTPSERRLAHIMDALREEHHRYEMPEQSFLTLYAGKEENMLDLMYLDKKWNSCVGGGTLFNRGLRTSGYNFLHSCSWGAKPANVRMCFPGDCDENAELHTVLVWQQHHIAIDDCATHRQESTCEKVSKCSWCGHYCSDIRMPCSPKLFQGRSGSEVDVASQIAHFGEATTSCAGRSLGSWDSAPVGWQAWPRAALYQVLIDRFATSFSGPCADLKGHCGGTFRGMVEKLPYLDELGVDGILMSPVVENMPGGYHGYWPSDLNKINPKFGSEDELKELVLSAHKQHMKVVVDVNLNHAGGPGVEIEELIPKLKPFNKAEHYHSPSCSLFSPSDFRQRKQVMEQCQLFGLPDYNHENPFVATGLQKWLRSHVDTFGFDGIRIDAAHHMPRRFLNRISQSDPPVPAFHEVISSDLKGIVGYAGGDFDAVYNYPLYFILRSVFAEFPGETPRPLTDLVDKLDRDELEGKLSLNFLDNNDMPRFARMAKDEAQFRNALLYVLGTEGVPVLLYGSEQNVRGKVTSSDPVREEPPDQWRPALWSEGYSTNGTTFRMLQRTLWLRSHFDGFHQHKQVTVHSDHEVLVFARGPFFFVVTTGRTNHAQRVLWHNETVGCKAIRRCDLLADDIRASCRLVIPGAPDYYDLDGTEPHLDVPESVAEEWLEEHMASNPGQIREGNTALSGMSALSLNTSVALYTEYQWHEVPGVAVEVVETVGRIKRSFLPVGVKVSDPASWQPVSAFETLDAVDPYAPPIGTPVDHVEHLSVKNACLHKEADQRAVIYSQSGSLASVLCPKDYISECWKGTRSIVAEPAPSASVAVLHLSYGGPDECDYGCTLMHLLPRIAPYVSSLRAGVFSLFVEEYLERLHPVLERLGIAGSVLYFPENSSSALPVVHHFCSSEVRVLRHWSQGSPHPDASLLQTFRSALLKGVDLRKRSDIVLFSDTFPPRDRQELVRALESLGRPVVLLGGDASFGTVIATLNRAAAVVGRHGAQMANIIFAPAGTKVLEIVPQASVRMDNHRYGTLSGALRFDYRPVAEVVSFDVSGGVRKDLAAVLEGLSELIEDSAF